MLDTDTYNEIDDQFAVAHALLSPDRMRVEAIHATPFHNDRSDGPADGMQKSYDEILTLLDRMGQPQAQRPAVRKGSAAWLPDKTTPVESEAAKALLEHVQAAEADGERLYVIAIGALTNVASSLLMDPSIAPKMTLLWLGGQPTHWDSAKEFNLRGDLKASQVVYESKLPLLQFPCACVAENLRTTLHELEAHIGGKGPLCDYLVETFRGYHTDHYAWAKEIWDLAPIGWMVNPDFTRTRVTPRPRLTDSIEWDLSAPAADAGPFVEARRCWRNPIFKDLFRKLEAFEAARS